MHPDSLGEVNKSLCAWFFPRAHFGLLLLAVINLYPLPVIHHNCEYMNIIAFDELSPSKI